jgi:carbonic anhydrase/acetyltransferase-like protein (isoleucine patch superfamily)
VPLFAFEGREPAVSSAAWIAPTATLVSDVRVEAEASIWYGAVLRELARRHAASVHPAARPGQH